MGEIQMNHQVLHSIPTPAKPNHSGCFLSPPFCTQPSRSSKGVLTRTEVARIHVRSGEVLACSLARSSE